MQICTINCHTCCSPFSSSFEITYNSAVDRSSKVCVGGGGGGGGGVCVGGGGVISDFKKNTENILRTNARERSDQARGSEATDRGEGVGPPSHGREIFQFWGSESCNLVHAVMRFLTLYLIRITFLCRIKVSKRLSG